VKLLNEKQENLEKNKTMKLSKKLFRKRQSLRGSIKGTLNRPRLSVFRSNQHIYAQIIDDDTYQTLVTCSTLDKEVKTSINKTSTCETSKIIGQKLAERSRAKNINQIIFDRGPYIYHGRIKALAEGAREGGLIF
jgi:large subunit ribosomal protein L18